MALAACDNAAPVVDDTPPPPATTGILTGTISLPAGASGSVDNTRVALYADEEEYYDDAADYEFGVRASGSYTIPNVEPGTYYVDAWKDNNSNGVFDGGDFYGVYGTRTEEDLDLTPVTISAGATENVTFQIMPCPAVGCF